MSSSLVLLWACACTTDPSIASSSYSIVSGTPDTGDPATVFLWLGGGSCSGTLVSPKTVLTAKHCIDGTTASQVQVFFGNNAEAAGTWIDATRLTGHPTTDIAMIAMAEPGPTMWIPLNTTALTGMEGTPVHIVGFGVTGENASDSGLKRHGMTTLYDLQDDVMYIGDSGSKTCYGDSGGPAFMTFGGTEHVAGVTSFGTSVCESGLSGEIRVDPYVDWINTFIDTEDPAQCTSDTRCVTTGCATPDPDCGGGTPPDPDPPPDPGTDTDPEPDPDTGGGDPDPVPDPEPDPPGTGEDLVGGCAVGGAGREGALAPLLVIGAILLRRSQRRARRGS